MTTNKKCLLLNCDFTPISIIDWKRAIIWYIKYLNNIKYGIQIIEHYNDTVLCANGESIPLPAVARTINYHRLNHDKFDLKLSRKNLFARDDYICQYCGKYLSRNNLTYDHVIPKCKFKNQKSATTWTNIVTACRKCNSKKANRTPKEADMQLINQPTKPKFSPKYLPWHDQLTTILIDSDNIWDKYIERYIKNYEGTS